MKRMLKRLIYLLTIFSFLNYIFADEAQNPSKKERALNYTAKAKLVRATDEKQIEGLKFINDEATIHVEPFGEEIRFIATIEGEFKEKNFDLTANNQVVQLNENQEFKIDIEISKKAALVEFIATDENGKTFIEKVGILFSDWDLTQSSASTNPPKRLFISAGLGATYFKYKETAQSDYSSFATTIKGNLNYLLFPPKWDLGLSLYLTAIQLTKSNPNNNVRYFGFNTRLGYIIDKVKDPWKLIVYGGFYYTTMIVDPSNFGFTNLSGPQVYPTIKRTLKNKDSINGYIKYSPIAKQLSLLKLTSREFALGTSYTHQLPNGKTISATLDFANVVLQINDIASSSNSVTLGASYGF
jgi:hypothetical protein